MSKMIDTRSDHTRLAVAMEDGREAVVAASLRELDREARCVFALRYRSLLRVEEIAQAMQMSPRCVRRILSSGLTMARAHLVGWDPTFSATSDADLLRLLRRARRSDILPGLRRWADGKVLGEFRGVSEQRRRVGRAVKIRRAMRAYSRLAEDQAFLQEWVEEAEALQRAGDLAEAEDVGDEAGLDEEDAA